MKLYELNKAKTFSVCAENPHGLKGGGGKSTDGAAKDCARDLGTGWKISPYYIVKSGETKTLMDIEKEAVIKHIWIADSSDGLRNLIIRFYWDGCEFPSIEVPLGDFFAAADYSANPSVKSIPVCVNTRRALNSYWEMPFRNHCKITVENLQDKDVMVFYQIDCSEEKIPENACYFNAQFRRTNPLPYKEVYTILDNINGTGKYVGTYMYWSTKSNGWWGEGEIKFYLDGDKEFPTICGTGTEDYFCGAWCFAENEEYKDFSSPYSGFSANKTDNCLNSQKRFSMYRWHLTDPIHFDENIRVTIQALGWRSEGRYLPLMDDISSVAYFYTKEPADVSGTLPDKDGLEIL